MKTIGIILITMGLTLTLFGCDQNILTDKKNSSIGDDFDNDPKINLAFSSTLPNITLENSQDYPVNGVCDSSSGTVTVIIGTPNVTKNFTCDLNGNFSGTINVSTVTLNPPNISATQGKTTASADLVPINDQNGPISAPVATSPGAYIGGVSLYPLSILCNEAGEIVSISGAGIDPSTQTYTCTDSGAEDFPLMLASLTETSNPNELTISSTDEYNNPSDTTTTVNVPIDNVIPVVSVTAGSDVIQGQRANFSIAVTDLNISTLSYTVNTSGPESAPYTCTTNPCSVTTEIIQSPGELTLTVGANSVADDLGNMGDSVVKSDSLTVSPAGALGFNNPLSTINTQNASSYPLAGVCDAGLGNVTVTVGGVSESISCNAPGVFSSNIDLTSVNLNPAEINVEQGVKTAPASPFPVNDQTPILSAPTIADQNYKNGSSTTLAINCNEAGEVVKFTNASLNPTEQTYTCLSSGSENVTLDFATGQETNNLNSVTVSSVDVNDNPTTNNSSFKLPIDNVAPTLTVSAGANIVEGSSASFTVTISDGNSFTAFTPIVSSGTISPSACSQALCQVTVIGATPGTLTLTVDAGDVVDVAGNANATLASDNLTVSVPRITASTIVSTDGDNDTWYENSDIVSIQIQYNADVVVDTSNGTPTLEVTLSSGTKTATYSQGSGSQTLDFTMPIQNNDYQCNGRLALESLNLNGGTIEGRLGGTADNSNLPSTAVGAKIDAKNPTAPSGLSSNSTNAFNNFSSELSWTQSTDECGLSNIEYGLGTSSGGLDTQSYIDIGLVAAYQAQSGNDSALFNLVANTNYYTSIRSVDNAGNMSQAESSLAWSFTCSDPWAGISRLVALDSSNEESIFDATNLNASNANFDGLVNRWEDQSGSDNHLEAPLPGARPSYNHDSPSSGLDSYVQGDGFDDTLVKDINDISTDFTFYYVLNALSTTPSEFESYFSNTDNNNDVGGFQLDIGGPTRLCQNQFRILLRHTAGVAPIGICGANYTTGKHVLVVNYNAASTSMSFSVDGTDYGTYNNLTTAPVFSWIRLFQNRSGNQFQEAQALELHLVNQDLDNNNRDAISTYLTCKWNVQL